MSTKKGAISKAQKQSKTRQTTMATTAVAEPEIQASVEAPKNEVKAVKQLGRPANPNSARQAKIQEIQQKKALGIVVRQGRPTDPNSARQIKKTAIENKKALGLPLYQGRPANPNSARQQKLQAAALRQAQGINVKLGRPKAEVTAEPVVAGNEA